MSELNILVCVKQAYDVQQLKADPKTNELIFTGAPKIISDMDKRALEEALRIKEKLGGTVRTVSVGPPDVKNVSRELYAMGADEVLIIADEKLEKATPSATARLIAALVEKLGNIDLILAGAASTDEYDWQVPGKVAELLNLPYLPNATSLDVSNKEIVAECDLGDAIYKFKSQLPAVVSVSLEINTPRIPTLSSILKASKRQPVTYSAQDLCPEIPFEMETLRIVMPKVERRRVITNVLDLDQAKMDGELRKIVEELRKEGVI